MVAVYLYFRSKYINTLRNYYLTFFHSSHWNQRCIQGSRGEISLGKSIKRDRWAFICNSGYHTINHSSLSYTMLHFIQAQKTKAGFLSSHMTTQVQFTHKWKCCYCLSTHVVPKLHSTEHKRRNSEFLKFLPNFNEWACGLSSLKNKYYSCL